jgi:enoyl-CoA hydratase/carnithine racemase
MINNPRAIPLFESTNMNNPDNQNIGVAVSIKDGINIIKFDRIEKKNAITKRMYDAMSQALTGGDQNASVRVHLFLGGSGVFTAGNDLSDFVGSNLNEAGLGQEVLSFLEAVITADKPLIAAVDGAAIGIGTTLLMHCDLVYATPRSFFQTPFVDLGLVPEAASSLVAPRLFGPQRAFSLLVLGHRWSAQDAVDAGLVNGVIEEQEIESKTIELARELAQKPQQALTTTRRLLRGDPAELLARVNEEAEHFSRHLCSEEAQAAFSKFFKRR